MSNHFLFLKRVILSVQFTSIIMSSIFGKILDLISQILFLSLHPLPYMSFYCSKIFTGSPIELKNTFSFAILASVTWILPAFLIHLTYIIDATLRASLGVFPIMRKLGTLHCGHAFCLWPRVVWLLYSWDWFLHISINQIYPPKQDISLLKTLLSRFILCVNLTNIITNNKCNRI